LEYLVTTHRDGSKFKIY